MIATETTEDTEGKYSVLSVYSVAENKEKIIFDNRTQMNADNQDFKFNLILALNRKLNARHLVI